MPPVTAVTPFAGVWIEITGMDGSNGINGVTPFAGVWIEMHRILRIFHTDNRSLPSRECGLKLKKSQGKEKT